MIARIIQLSLSLASSNTIQWKKLMGNTLSTYSVEELLLQFCQWELFKLRWCRQWDASSTIMSTFDAHFGFAWCDCGVAFGAHCGAPLHSVHRKIKKPCKVASLGVIDAACRMIYRHLGALEVAMVAFLCKSSSALYSCASWCCRSLLVQFFLQLMHVWCSQAMTRLSISWWTRCCCLSKGFTVVHFSNCTSWCRVTDVAIGAIGAFPSNSSWCIGGALSHGVTGAGWCLYTGGGASWCSHDLLPSHPATLFITNHQPL